MANRNDRPEKVELRFRASGLLPEFWDAVTGSQRVKVQADTARALLVVYVPTGVVTPDAVAETLTSLAARAGVFEVGEVSASA